MITSRINHVNPSLDSAMLLPMVNFEF
jgi:hypothetical protein